MYLIYKIFTNFIKNIFSIWGLCLALSTILPLGGEAKKSEHQWLRFWRNGGSNKLSLFWEGQSTIYPLPARERKINSTGTRSSFVAAGNWFRSSCLMTEEIFLRSLRRPILAHFGGNKHTTCSCSQFSLV